MTLILTLKENRHLKIALVLTDKLRFDIVLLIYPKELKPIVY